MGESRLPLPVYWLLLVAVILAAAAVQAFYAQPKLGTDAQIWVDVARQLRSGEFSEHKLVYHWRIYWSLFLAAVDAVYPLTYRAFVPVMLLLLGLSTVLVAQTTRLLAGERWGLLAGAVYASHPLVLTYGTFMVSDALAVPVFLLSLYFIFRHLEGGGARDLAFASLAAGSLYFIKAYLALIIVPVLIAAMAASPTTLQQRMLRAATALGPALAAVAAGYLAHWLVYGDPFWYHRTGADYAERLESRGNGLDLATATAGDLARLLQERLAYLRDLFWDPGPFAAFWGLFGALSLLAGCLRSLPLFILAGLFYVYLLFFMFAPVQFNPLLLVETQVRYLCVLIPLLAIGAGLAGSRMAPAFASSWPWAATATVAILWLAGLTVPNATADRYYNRYKIADYLALETVLHSATPPERGRLLVPSPYRAMFHDALEQGPVEVVFVDIDELANPAALRRWFSSATDTALFLRRKRYDRLADHVRIRELSEADQYEQAAELAALLEASGFRRRAVHVPYSPFRRLAESAGLSSRGELVGWVFTPAR